MLKHTNSSSPISSIIGRPSIGPWLVSLAAILWATDAIFRSQLTDQFSALFIVLLTHILCLPVTLSTVVICRKKIKNFRRSDIVALLVLALGGSVTAMILFTQSFAQANNYNVPILLQKLQPLVAILLAKLFLKEEPKPLFYLLAGAAIIGSYLVSFGDQGSMITLKDSRLSTVAYALGAAIIWGACTVAGRHFMSQNDSLIVTNSRYLLATAVLTIVFLLTDDWTQWEKLSLSSIKTFAMMAFIPGLLALYIYYSGLKTTPASIATISELSFPIAAVFINWSLLDSPLTLAQIIGALLLVASTTAIHYQQKIKK